MESNDKKHAPPAMTTVRYTGETGNVHYGDAPLEQGKTLEVNELEAAALVKRGDFVEIKEAKKSLRKKGE